MLQCAAASHTYLPAASSEKEEGVSIHRDSLDLNAMCCSVWQCVAVCCSVLNCVAVCYTMLQCAAALQRVTHTCPQQAVIKRGVCPSTVADSISAPLRISISTICKHFGCV